MEESGPERELQDLVREELYAIAKESLLNALRHANATSIVCELRYEKNNLVFECRDDGVGLPAYVLAAGRREGHYGLLGVKERAERIGAAALKIESASGGERPSTSMFRAVLPI